MTTQPRAFKSIMGKRLGVGAYGQVATQTPTTVLDITPKCVDATISISAEGASVANQRDITITLKDAHGNAIDYAENFEIVMYLSSAMTDFMATGGSTGIAAGASGKILAVVAKKIFRCITTTAGVCQVIYTDTGTEAGYLGVTLPNGRVVAGGVITNA